PANCTAATALEPHHALGYSHAWRQTAFSRRVRRLLALLASPRSCAPAGPERRQQSCQRLAPGRAHIAAAGMGSRIVGAELLRAGAHRRDGCRRGRRIAPARPVRHSVADRYIVGAADRRNAVSLWLAPAAASPVGVPGHTAAAAVGRARLDPCLGRSRAAGGQPPPGARTHQPQTLAHGLAPAIPYAFRLGVSPVIAGVRQRALEQLHPGRYGLLDVAAAGAAPVGHRAGAGLDTRAARLWRGGSPARGLQCGAHVAYSAGAGGGLRRGQPAPRGAEPARGAAPYWRFIASARRRPWSACPSA